MTMEIYTMVIMKLLKKNQLSLLIFLNKTDRGNWLILHLNNFFVWQLKQKEL